MFPDNVFMYVCMYIRTYRILLFTHLANVISCCYVLAFLIFHCSSLMNSPYTRLYTYTYVYVVFRFYVSLFHHHKNYAFYNPKKNNNTPFTHTIQFLLSPCAAKQRNVSSWVFYLIFGEIFTTLFVTKITLLCLC